jgi:hypothetical protein
MAKGKKDKKNKGRNESVGASDSGAKISKKLRKAGNKALNLAREPMVSEIVAAALLSAAAALRDNKKVTRAASAAGAEALDGSLEAGKQATKVGDALRGLALDLARRTLDNWDRSSGAKTGKGGKGSGNPDAAGPDSDA